MRRGLVRWTAVFIIAMSFAVAYKAYRVTTVPSETITVSACTYFIEHTNTATTQFWSPYFAAYDVLHAEIISFAGNIGSGYRCGLYREYESLQWTTLGTPGSYYTEVRTWTCGGYDGAWANHSSVQWSPEEYSAVCGRQADNLNSYFHVNASGANVSVYVNQG